MSKNKNYEDETNLGPAMSNTGFIFKGMRVKHQNGKRWSDEKEQARKNAIKRAKVYNRNVKEDQN